MNKNIIILAFLLSVIAYTEATNRPQCPAVCRKNQPSIVRCVRDENGCRRMKQCSIEEENCRRRHINRKPLRTTSSSLCRHLKSPLGAGRCAPKKPIRIPRTVGINCHRLQCTNPSKKLNCYRSSQNECLLVTPCQLNHINCLRGRNNALTWTDVRQCKGMKNGQALQRCRRVPQRD